MVHEDIKKAVEQGDYATLKYTFADGFDGDPTFEYYNDDYEYCRDNSDFFEPHRNLTPMSSDNIDIEYWMQLKDDFIANPSIERLEHMRSVASVLYRDRIDSIRAKKEAEQRAATVQQAQPEAQQKAAAQQELFDAQQRAAAAQQAQTEMQRRAAVQQNQQINSDNVRRVSVRSQYQDPPAKTSSDRGSQPKKANGMKLVLVAIIAIIIVILVVSNQNAEEIQSATAAVTEIMQMKQ